MCRNIRVLSNFEPPTTEDEIRAAALQYVRKVSGTRSPSRANQACFDRAVERIAEVTRELLAAFEVRPPARSREEEARKARERGARRQGDARSTGADAG